MSRSYSMRGVQGAADRAVALVRQFVRTIDPTSVVHDVQADPRFQHRGVDLLWERAGHPVQGLEVKGDRQGRRGNYFFELISNLEKDTPGCFLYTLADAYLYVFLDLEEVHVLPMPATREWFLKKAKEFPLRHARTKTGNATYTTVGALVPIRTLMREVAGAERHRLVDPATTKERGTHGRREHR
ncbi:MAG: hypothetical protein IRZ16_17660 [Myxococcaceae bacterium]|nr:hypothetical protein [Myxococcaceae bacterium]